MAEHNYREMIRIPESTYVYRVVHRIMEGDCAYDHGPVIKHMPAFDIGKYPVTNAMYYEFIQASGYHPVDDHNFLKHWVDGKFREEEANNPVVWVSQKDAKAYAKWVGGRLPHDWEWQYAAAGPSGKNYPWGEYLEKERCNCEGKRLTPVDKYPHGASDFGLMDMIGNAREWVEELLDDGMHKFTFLRGGCYFQAQHFWHADGGPRPTNHHLKFQLLSESQNRCGTTSFRIVKEV